MEKSKEFWIRKGENTFDYTFYDDETDTDVKDLSRGDQFYDAIVSEPYSGGIHVIEHAAYAKAVAALKDIEQASFKDCVVCENSSEYAYALARDALEELGEL